MKYLHALLTVIAICLLIITCNILGFIPSAQANTTSPHFATVPINADGSINVKFEKGETMDVNIDEVGGYPQRGSAVNVNLDQVDGSDVDYPLHVTGN